MLDDKYTSSPVVHPDWLDQVIIRRIRKEDLPALEWDGEFTYLRRVYAHAFHSQQSGKAILWVAELPKVGIIGQIFLQMDSDRLELADGIDRAHIYSFRIKPAYRGAGLGSHMLQKVEKFLRSAAFRYVTLNVAKDNPKALDLYRRHGFQIIGHEAGRWTFPDENGVWQEIVNPAWRMQKTLL